MYRNRSYNPNHGFLISKVVFIALVCYYIFLCFPPEASAKQEIIGRITVVKGSVNIERPGLGGVSKVRSGTELFIADVLTVGSGSSAQLALNDESAVVYIAPGASLRVNQYAYAPETLRRKVFIRLLNGKARFVSSKKMSRGSAIIVETDSAKITASGQDDFVVKAAPQATEVMTLIGSVIVKNASDFVVGEIILSENLITTVNEKTPPSRPDVMKAKQRSEYIREVR